MPLLFQQYDFSGGLNTKVDLSKTPRNSYNLGINVRSRRNAIYPIKGPVKLYSPAGNKQGIIAIGSVLILVSDGLAYRLDLATTSTFFPIGGFPPMQTTSRVFMQLVPVTFNLMSRLAITSQDVNLVYNNSIATFPELVIVQDGVSVVAGISPNNIVDTLGTNASWTMDSPTYVPLGKQMAMVGSKLFITSLDGKREFQSVSGRPTDFVVNVTSDGDAGTLTNVEFTTAVAVSGQEVTALYGADDGSLLVGTNYGTHLVTLDRNNLIFGEPYLDVRLLFPIGPVNERSIARLNGDTAFISLNGINSFNVAQQLNRESNNYPLGAMIRGLLNNPQKDTCAINYDDTALFAVDTIYGRATVSYDNTMEVFDSLDFDKGQVKQFATTKYDGEERLFYIGSDDEVYEAFVGETTQARVVLPEWTARDAQGAQSRAVDAMSFAECVNVQLEFADVKTSGTVKIVLTLDGKQVVTYEQPVAVTAPTNQLDKALPRADRLDIMTVDFNFDPVSGRRVQLEVVWDFDGGLSAASVNGSLFSASAPDLTSPAIVNTPDKFAVMGNTEVACIEIGALLTPVTVTQGNSYYFKPTLAGIKLTDGLTVYDKECVFIASGTTIYFNGFEAICYDVTSLANIKTLTTGRTIIFNGNSQPFHPEPLAFMFPGAYYTAGPDDVNNFGGLYVFNANRKPSRFSLDFTHTKLFFYNPGLNSDAAVLTDGIAAGPTNEPGGFNATSVQAKQLEQQLKASNKFNIVFNPLPPYSDFSLTPGYMQMRLDFTNCGLIISGTEFGYQRFAIEGKTYVVNGSFDPYSATSFIASDTLMSYSKSQVLVTLLDVDNFGTSVKSFTPTGELYDEFYVTG